MISALTLGPIGPLPPGASETFSTGTFTDNAVLRGDGTGTRGIQGSGVLVDDGNRFILPGAGAASTASMAWTGAIFTGGTGTTTLPHLFYSATGTTGASTWSTGGTVFGVNLPSGYSGRIMDFRLNGGSSPLFSVNNDGAVTCGTVTSSASLVVAAAGVLSFSTRARIKSPADGQVDLRNAADTDFANLNSSGVAIKQAANGKAGTFTLVAGSAVVSNTAVTANSVIIPTVKTAGGVRAGNPDCVPTPGVGFTATGGGSDTSVYNYVIIEAAP